MSDEKSLMEEILDMEKNRNPKDSKLLFSEDFFSSNDEQPHENKNSTAKKQDNIILEKEISKEKKEEEKEKETNNAKSKILKLEKVRNENIKSENIVENKVKEETKDKAQNSEIIKKKTETVQKTEKNQNTANELQKEEKQIKKHKEPSEKEKKKAERQKKIHNFFIKKKTKVMTFTPYIRTETDVRAVMKDVIIALFPAIIAAGLVYGTKALLVISSSVLGAVVTEKIFSKIFLDDTDSVRDLSAVITGILLALTLAPLTPLPVVLFGGSMAVIFGKLMYGGIGRNTFNPAVMGREFMTVFFPAVMSSGTIWFSQEALRISNISFFGKFSNTPFTAYLDGLLLTSSGSLGSYSAFALIIGGVYLLLKNRISWHIPASLFTVSFLAAMFLKDGISASMGGLLLTGIFMATDMPTSPSFGSGKVYYGIMIGAVIVLLSLLGIKNETLSYVLIILNPFTVLINKTFRPVVFAYNVKSEMARQIGKSVLLTFGIIAATVIWVMFHRIGIIPYLIYLYIIVLTLKLIMKSNKDKIYS